MRHFDAVMRHFDAVASNLYSLGWGYNIQQLDAVLC